MKYAIIADVHSNLEALQRVLKEIKFRKINQIVCLGDVIGYAANPKECLKIVTEISRTVVMGNHERALEDIDLRFHFHDMAVKAIAWTSIKLTAKEKEIVRKFPYITIDKKNDTTWTHGSIHEPHLFHYLLDDQNVSLSFHSLETKIGFFGHTHVPSIYSESGRASYLAEGVHKLDPSERYLVNPGSVGQPRERDRRLSFSIYDSDQYIVEIIRLPYDNKRAAQKIRKAGLPEFLAERL
ncbi:MAG: hypothetical protein A3G33_02375 [Omnitrophica bacterium RIFCSPLOWO2_12_FULL_44_17]|uniref:Calcineurin-like phosphoesterase domain-containing protein n=1 Tax=Candidatus Danuiimicrobium aquiferis TaxID=1801832 RepID=A0A1G1L173_9BACT|nr:MAG: hypothetical protein A3B72_01955 [Omnitrophica bacterium RIFCSPHIGHO2_02_FULL_45_28]OGW90353.1 MAG: hypothetical protein A3E74_01425 [Omnitrophica bacterium RIFCSPHIGHO2_12_FULL_44_12]OGW98886.1 MAG: hypothetical protein A3G33_02375 [Omnitrophica bacterium RIFCSPLOWO2_12_FULL_44_17]OGX02012.1 MAG: hypothetical protein A3J12_11370 [Omnitrophica bacterium RIFCSPLOWO2_02_FULL_44_11]